MRVLLDTCVLSELYKPEPLPAVYEAVNNIQDENLYLSVITVGEIGKGIALLPDSRRKQELSAWFTHIGLDMNIPNVCYRLIRKPQHYGGK